MVFKLENVKVVIPGYNVLGDAIVWILVGNVPSIVAIVKLERMPELRFGVQVRKLLLRLIHVFTEQFEPSNFVLFMAKNVY